MHILMTLFAAASLLHAPPPIPVPTRSGKPAPAPWIAKREKLATITKGMDEHEVMELLGSPDDIRSPELDGRQKDGWARGGAYQWAYGCSEHEAFAIVGIVDFDATGLVLLVRRPDKPKLLRTPPTPAPPPSDKATPTDKGVSLRLGEVQVQDEATPVVSVALINNGPETYRYKCAPWGLNHHVIVELFDTDKKLLLACDHLLARKPTSTRARTLAANEYEGVELPFWKLSTVFGKPIPGPYLLRVALPVDDGSFLYSNAVRFTPTATKKD